MKRILCFLFVAVSIAAWCTPSFATTLNGTQTLGAGVTDAITFNNGGGTVKTLTINDGKDVFEAIPNNQASPGVATNSALTAIATDNSSLSDIKFNGSSTVYGGIGATAPFFNQIHGGTANTTVNFLGDVYASQFIFSADSTVSLAVGKTVTNGAVTTTGPANSGTILLNSGSNWGGTSTAAVTGIKAVNILGGTNTAGVSATITGAVGAKQFSLLTNTLNMTGGALTIAANGTIDTTLASSSIYGKIMASGQAANFGDFTINALIPAATYIPLGTKFDIIQAASVTGGIVPTIISSNPLYKFSVFPITGTTGTNVTIETTANPITASKTSTDPAAPLAAPVADALITLPATSDVVLAVNALTTAAAVVNAEAQLAPSTPALAAPLAIFQGTRQFQNLWLSRLDMCQVNLPDPNVKTGISSGDEMQGSGDGVWAKGFGYSGHQSDRGAFPGYNIQTYGMMVAYDKPVGINTRAGLGFGYSWSTIDGKTYDANTDFGTYEATAYIGHESGPWFVHGSTSFGWNEYSSKRHIVFPGVDRTAEADFSGQDYTAFANTGYHFYAKKFVITPIASLQYSHLRVDGYTEDGAGDVNLKVGSQDYDFVESGLGMKVEREFSYRGRSYIPEIHFKWLHELNNPKLEQDAAFTPAGSATFTTTGPRTNPNMYSAGFGITLFARICRPISWSLEVVYDHDWNNNYYADKGTLRLSSRF